MLKWIAVGAALMITSGCAWSNKVYGSLCTKAGHTAGTADHAACVEQAKRDGQQQTLSDLGVGAVVAAGVYGASQAALAPAAGPGQNVAPLVGENVSGSQRVCQYQTRQQLVSVVVNSATSCPRSYLY